MQRLDDMVYANYTNYMCLKETLPDPNNLEEDIIKKDEYREVKKVIASLSDLEKQIILLYFGFNDNKRYTQTEISKQLNLSQSHISKKLKTAKKHIKNKIENYNNEIK